MLVTTLHRVGRSVLQWAAIITILGHCRLWVVRSYPVVRYFNRAILTYYVWHQTVLVVVAYWLKRMCGLSNGSFIVILASTTIICMTIYELQRRSIALLRSCLSSSPGSAKT